MAYATIVGATGYSGQETLDRVLAHPELELHAVGSDSLAGRSAAELDPRLNRNGGKRVPHFVTNDAALASGADVVIDLSGAHRLQDSGLYETWYGFEHPRPAELERWAYGLPEVAPPQGRLIA